jgi:hypothetical protein
MFEIDRQSSVQYYTLDKNPLIEERWIDIGAKGESREIVSVHWMTGRTIEKPLPSPLHTVLKPIEPGMGEYLSEYLEGLGSITIFRDDLIEALQQIGVNNLQLFDLDIYDPINREIYTNYKGVNVVGVVDLVKSARLEGDIMDNVVLDETKPNPLLMFRILDEEGFAGISIIVHRKVAEYLEDKGFKGLVFYEVGDVAM